MNLEKGINWVSSSGNLEGVQSHVVDQKEQRARVAKHLAAKEAGRKPEEKKPEPFKSNAEKVMEELYLLGQELVSLRKRRGDKEKIKEIENQIQLLKNTPEYKGALN